MTQKSIRFRLAVWYSLALAAGLALFAIAIWFSMKHSLRSEVDKGLQKQVQSLAAFMNEELADAHVRFREELDEYSQGLPQGTYMEVLDSAGTVAFASPGLDFRRFPKLDSNLVLRRIHVRHHQYRVLAAKVMAGGRMWQVEFAASLDTIDQLLSRLRLLLVVLIPAIVLIASVGGNWLSRRALRPVDEITAAARSIGISNLSARLAVPETGDELQRLSETWNSMLARLEDAVKRLSRFTADASHELRTPLAVIRTTAEIASRKSRSAESYREALAEIVAESERMTHLVEDLLFLARCDSEAVDMPMGSLDLANIVAQVSTELTGIAESRSLRLISHVGNRKALVEGNELAVRRLVVVLLDNAIKYSRTGGEVHVALHERPHEVQLEISDSGPGISDAEMPYIFERFYRAPQAREYVESGCGLGLSLAAGIAQRHRARIEVESVPEKGSTFRVMFQPLET